MKNPTLISALLIAFTLFSCQQNVNVEKEKDAILQVLLDEGKTFSDYDINALSALHIQDETALRLEGGENVYQGWDEISKLYQRYIKMNKSFNEENPITNWINNKENVITKVIGNAAWSVCDNIWSWEAEGEKGGFTNKQMTFLEKIDGEWKISSIAFIPILDTDKKLGVSLKYHELNPDNMDEILTEDFVGRNEKSRFTWTKEQHKKFWSENPEMATDSIFSQIAQGDWVATRFQREMLWEGKNMIFESMHFKRFEEGKIAEIWEYGDSKQVE